ncbi:hypothetical protein GCM10023083_30230 [Streptomyces phyllanthi]
MLGDATCPAEAPAAAEEGALELGGGGCVEPLHGRGADGGAELLRDGDLAGEVGKTVRGQRGSSAVCGDVLWMSRTGRLGRVCEMCRHVIEGGQRLSERSPNFTRTEEFRGRLWTVGLVGRRTFEVEVCDMGRHDTGRNDKGRIRTGGAP